MDKGVTIMRRFSRVLSVVMVSILLLVMFVPSALAATKNSIKNNTTVTITTGSGVLYSLKLKQTEVKCSIDTSKLSSTEAALVKGKFTAGLQGAITFTVKITAPNGTVTTQKLYNNQTFKLSGSATSYKVLFAVPGGYPMNVTTSAGTIR